MLELQEIEAIKQLKYKYMRCVDQKPVPDAEPPLARPRGPAARRR